jgi:hypothetical protein
MNSMLVHDKLQRGGDGRAVDELFTPNVSD